MASKISILSFNIHKGYGHANLSFNLLDLKKALRSLHVDVIFLQEVMAHCDRDASRITDWPSTNQFEYLADQIWHHHAYGQNAVSVNRNYGNAILSKFPIVFHENIDISTNPLERRGLLHAVIEIPEKNKKMHLLNVHLDLFKKGRLKQAERIIDRVVHKIPHSEPMILAGDFNDWREQFTPILANHLKLSEAHLELAGDHAKTFPSFWPTLKLDRIYYRDLKTLSCSVLDEEPWSLISDHVPLRAEFGY